MLAYCTHTAASPIHLTASSPHQLTTSSQTLRSSHISTTEWILKFLILIRTFFLDDGVIYAPFTFLQMFHITTSQHLRGRSILFQHSMNSKETEVHENQNNSADFLWGMLFTCCLFFGGRTGTGGSSGEGAEPSVCVSRCVRVSWLLVSVSCCLLLCRWLEVRGRW